MDIQWVAEYSSVQKCWNIDRLKVVMSINRELAIKGVNTGYQILYIGNYDDCFKFIHDFQNAYNIAK